MHLNRNQPVVQGTADWSNSVHLPWGVWLREQWEDGLSVPVLSSLTILPVSTGHAHCVHPYSGVHLPISWINLLSSREPRNKEQSAPRRSEGRPGAVPRYCKLDSSVPWRHHSLLHHLHATAAAKGAPLSIKALQSPDPQSNSRHHHSAERTTPWVNYKHLWIMCIRKQEGCYLSKAVPQSLKNSICNSGQCPALRSLTNRGKTGHVPSANVCWAFMYF